MRRKVLAAVFLSFCPFGCGRGWSFLGKFIDLTHSFDEQTIIGRLRGLNLKETNMSRKGTILANCFALPSMAAFASMHPFTFFESRITLTPSHFDSHRSWRVDRASLKCKDSNYQVVVMISFSGKGTMHDSMTSS
jgi:hypothetical protein